MVRELWTVNAAGAVSKHEVFDDAAIVRGLEARVQVTPDDLDSLVDFPEIAGLYSQLSGVLAGFVFTSLIGLIGAQIATRHPLDFTLRSYRPLIAAFLGLVATSLNYAIIAGEEGKKPRVAQLEIVAGLGFCAAATMALYSILVLLRGVEADLSGGGSKSARTADLLRVTIIFGVCPLLFVLMWGAQRDHLTLKYGASAYGLLDLAYGVALLATLGFAVMAFLRFRVKESGRGLVEVVSRAAVSIAIASLFGSTLTISMTTKDSMWPDGLHLLCLVVLSVFVWLIIASSAMYRPHGVRPESLDAITTPLPPEVRTARVVPAGPSLLPRERTAFLAVLIGLVVVVVNVIRNQIGRRS